MAYFGAGLGNAGWLTRHQDCPAAAAPGGGAPAVPTDDVLGLWGLPGTPEQHTAFLGPVS